MQLNSFNNSDLACDRDNREINGMTCYLPNKTTNSFKINMEAEYTALAHATL